MPKCGTATTACTCTPWFRGQSISLLFPLLVSDDGSPMGHASRISCDSVCRLFSSLNKLVSSKGQRPQESAETLETGSPLPCPRCPSLGSCSVHSRLSLFVISTTELLAPDEMANAHSLLAGTRSSSVPYEGLWHPQSALLHLTRFATAVTEPLAPTPTLSGLVK